MQSGKVYNVKVHANSTCGVSNRANVTIDTKSRITVFETDKNNYNRAGLTLVDNETKLLVNDYQDNSLYVMDLKNSENSHYVDLKIDESKEMLLSVASKDGKYLYVVTRDYESNHVFNIYDMSSP
ncbi:MAG: hypothetical protein LBD84_04355 [Campylobacteraceae bacterium]|nr:hypothetical protein [Campylobacteraceae bacterium]